MKVISFKDARVVSLFPMEAFVPARGLAEQEFLNEVAARYRFARGPDLSVGRESLQENGLRFETGVITLDDGSVAPVNHVAIHNDGLVIAAHTTISAEKFFDDLHGWLLRDFGFRDVPTKRLFLSEIVVEFERPVSALITNYDALLDIVCQHMAESNRDVGEKRFSTLAFEFKGRKGEVIPRFIIEQRVGAELQRYYCSAPLRTEHHMATLEAVERLLA